MSANINKGFDVLFFGLGRLKDNGDPKNLD